MLTSRPTVLVALLTLVVLELVRSSGPLLDMAFSQGVVSAAGAALATYAAPALLAPLLVAAGRRAPGGAVLVGVAALVVLRLVVQGLSAGARFGVGLTTVALGIAVLVVAVDRLAVRAGGAAAARALAVGFAGAVGLQLGLGTWDAYWRHDALGWGVTVAVLAALVTAAWLDRDRAGDDAGDRAGDDAGDDAGDRGPEPRAHRVARLWTLGPALGLSAMLVANPAFAASQTATPLAVAGALLGVGWILATTTSLGTRTQGALEALTLVALVAGLLLTDSWGGLVIVVATPSVLVLVLVRTLEPRPGPALGPARAAGTALLVGLGTILPLLVYQLDYDVPLGVPNGVVLVVAAAVLGVGAVRRGPRPVGADAVPASPAGPPRGRRLVSPVAAALLLVVAGTGLAGARAVAGHRASELTPEMDLSDQLTLVNWNLHYGVDPAGALDLEQIARTIEEQDPDVVTLQEVSRGWVMGGGADAATWLADRLGMRMTFAPAADRQFGNAILTALPHDDARVLDLPYGAGPQQRSALTVDVTVGGGPVRVTSVHLQHREENTATRLDQLNTLLAATDADADAPAVIAGDLNAEPGWPEIALLAERYVSAVDVAGDPAALTSPSIDPAYRIDWVFGRRVGFIDARVLTDALSSDHLPIVVELSVGLPDDA